jgi:biopolymer transport protein ExbD
MKQSSPLGVQSLLKPEGEKAKKSLAADLLLTALIDAFSILVIFLLMTFSTSGEFLVVGKNVELPKAGSGEVLERFPVVRVEQDKIYLEEKQVTVDGLVSSLLDLRKNYVKTNEGAEFPGIITLQADRRINYESLNPIVLALSHAGFGEIRFAVLAQ